ncbi:MAG: hypothetical protein ACFFC6_11345 [Promethearchaeota archaeon]
MQNTKSWYQSSILVIGSIITILGAIFGLNHEDVIELTKQSEQILNAILIIVNTVGGVIIMLRRIYAENKPIKPTK